jgi:Fe-S-cluster containining protein
LNSEDSARDFNPGAAPMACRRCGVCCTRHQAYVRPEDIRRITAYLEITEADWQKLYDDPRWEFDNYRLIRHVNGACAFLRYDKGLAACVIHAVRPACCADWQPNPERRECREGMAGENGVSF